jgi:hypothetical protein
MTHKFDIINILKMELEMFTLCDLNPNSQL